MKPIVFIFGPSGVGKSHILNMFKKQKFQHMHIEDSGNKTFAAYGFPSEWDNDFSKVNYDYFIEKIKTDIDRKHVGFSISFPTSYRFTPENLNKVRSLGVVPILLWGSEENCKRAAEIRRNKKNLQFNLGRYDQKNLQTFHLYNCSEYDIYRLQAFQAGGSRFSDEELKNKILDNISKFCN